MSYQSREFFAQLIVAAITLMVFTEFIFAFLIFAKFRIFSLYSFSWKNSKFAVFSQNFPLMQTLVPLKENFIKRTYLLKYNLFNLYIIIKFPWSFRDGRSNFKRPTFYRVACQIHKNSYKTCDQGWINEKSLFFFDCFPLGFLLRIDFTIC